MNDSLVVEQTLRCDPDHAFRTWTGGGVSWWPSNHSVSGDPALTVVWEPEVGGRIYELTSGGQEIDWGEILVWDPPHRIVYAWFIASDRADATEVEVTFTASAEGTKMRIDHSGWENLGSSGPERKQANRVGWDDLVPRFEQVTRPTYRAG